jgi:hypothetical protein
LPSTIEQAHKQFSNQGLTILAVNIQERREVVAKWVKEKAVTSLVLLDPDGAVTGVYRVAGTPTVVLIGREGKMVGRAVGTRGWMSDAGRALLTALLSSPPARR